MSRCAGATDPENLLYMTRLGLWGKGTAFPNRLSFCRLLNKRGVGAMELVAMDLKMQGKFLARTLSYEGVRFEQVRPTTPSVVEWLPLCVWRSGE